MAKKKAGRKSRGRLTAKQRAFVAGKVAGKSDRRAALDAGYAKSTADNAYDKIYGKPSVQEKLREWLEQAGISDDLLALRLREGLDAKETKFFQHEGRVVSKRDVIDFGERRQYLELALKLCGYLVAKHEINAGPTLAEILEASFTCDTCGAKGCKVHQTKGVD